VGAQARFFVREEKTTGGTRRRTERSKRGREATKRKRGGDTKKPGDDKITGWAYRLVPEREKYV